MIYLDPVMWLTAKHLVSFKVFCCLYGRYFGVEKISTLSFAVLVWLMMYSEIAHKLGCFIVRAMTVSTRGDIAVIKCFKY